VFNQPSCRFLMTFATALGLLAVPITSADAWDGQYQQMQGQQGSQNLPPLQGRVVTAPAGTFMAGSVNSPISSEFARVGDRFNLALNSDVAAGGSVILPAGSQLEAQVVSVVKAGRTGRNGELDIRLTAGILPNGQRIPLSGRLQTEDGSGIIRGGTTGGRVGKAAVQTGVGAGLGAALGTAMGPLSGGQVGRGAIYGTAIGGGVGALASAWQKGHEAVVPAGQPLNIVLDQPLTVTPSAFSGPMGGQPYGAPQYGAPQYGAPAQYGGQQPYQQQPTNSYGGYDY